MSASRPTFGSPGVHFAHAYLAQCHYDRGDYRAAARKFQDALASMGRDDPLYRRGLAMSYLRSGEVEKAMAILHGIDACDGFAAQQSHEIAQAYRLWGEHQRERDCLRRASSLGLPLPDAGQAPENPSIKLRSQGPPAHR